MEEERRSTEGNSQFRAWDELPHALLGLILQKLVLRQAVRVIPMVCKSWGKYLEEPDCWKKINIEDWCCPYKDGDMSYDYRLRWLITRSSGCLRELSLLYVNADQMSFIAEHAGASLRKLSLPCCKISDSIAKQASRLSGLTTLDAKHCIRISGSGIESIGRNCQKLVSLTLGTQFNNPPEDEVVKAIIRTMPNLKHLCLDHFILCTDVALEMLSGCTKIETFDIRECWGCPDLNLLKEKHPNVKMLFREERVHYEDGETPDDYENDGTVPLGLEDCEHDEMMGLPELDNFEHDGINLFPDSCVEYENDGDDYDYFRMEMS